MTLALRRIYEDRQWPAQLGVPVHFSQSTSDPVGYQRPEVSDPSSATRPKWVEPTVARLQELAPLLFNWDQRGSAEVSIDALRFALNILSQVMPATAPAPSIVPLGHGGVQLLWHNAVADLEVEVVRPNEVVAYFFDKRTGQENEWPLTTDFADITNILWNNFTS
jgi:hypothetical protein